MSTVVSSQIELKLYLLRKIYGPEGLQVKIYPSLADFSSETKSVHSKMLKSGANRTTSMDVKKTNLFSNSNMRKINPDWFTAKVRMSEISGVIDSKEQNIYHVYFENGAKTKVHVHNGNQILVVTGGSGVLETFSKKGRGKENFGIKRTKTMRLSPGDIVHIKKGTLHTHGSSDKKRLFSHIAINIIPPKSKKYDTAWYESDFKTLASGIIK